MSDQSDALNRDWDGRLRALTPSLMTSIGVAGVMAQGRELVANYMASSRFTDAVSRRRQTMARAGIAIELYAPTDGASGPSAGGHTPRGALRDDATRARIGRELLELYFHQILEGGTYLLDVRPAVLFEDGGKLVWRPKPAFVAWNPEFIGSVGALYRAYFASDRAAFARAAGALRLEPAQDALWSQFGGDDPRSVRFSGAKFTASFTELLAKCKGGPKLHRHFLPLGLGIASLYEHLEFLDVSVDAVAAFEAAREGLSATVSS